MSELSEDNDNKEDTKMEQYTISWHMSGQEAVAHLHNIRDPRIVSKSENIDPERTKYNEIILDEDIKDVYDELFTESLDEWNKKNIQSRHPDRCIKDSTEYLRRCKESKQLHYAREIVLQVGNMTQHPDPEICCEILKKYIEDFIERNKSNIRVYSIVMHKDEISSDAPHAHLDLIMYSKNNCRGMKLRNSTSGALAQLGYKSSSKKENALVEFENYERAALEKIAREDYGLDIIHPMANQNQKHMKIEKVRMMKQIEALEEKQKKLEQELEKLEERHSDLVETIDDLEDYSIEKAEEILEEYSRGFIEEDRTR